MKNFRDLLKPSVFGVFLIISIIELPSTGQSQAPAFLSVIDDLPLMPGLNEDMDMALSFDTANGRIAETTVSGLVQGSGVIDYYARTLPQLGWKLVSLDRYLREDEVLNIEIAKSNDDKKPLVVHFRLSPTRAK